MDRDSELFEQLIEYLRGGLDEQERARIAQMLADDPVLRQMADFLADSRQADSGDWTKMRPATHSLLSHLLKDVKLSRGKEKGVRGVLTFDSRLLPLPEGVRHATVDTRRLRYQIGDQQLQISLYPVSTQSYELIGQISGSAMEGALKIKLAAGKTSMTAEANRFGIFRIPRVPIEKYTLRIMAGNRVIGVVELEL